MFPKHDYFVIPPGQAIKNSKGIPWWLLVEPELVFVFFGVLPSEVLPADLGKKKKQMKITTVQEALKCINMQFHLW